MRQRNHFRLSLPSGTVAGMWIIKCGDQILSSNRAQIVVADIGPGGIGFLSALRFPVVPTVIYRFSLPFIDEQLTVDGTIVWRKAASDGFRYGARFDLTEFERKILAQRLTRYAMAHHDLKEACKSYAGYMIRPKSRSFRMPD